TRRRSGLSGYHDDGRNRAPAVAAPVPAMPVNHYENFPVASWLLPAAMRRPVEAIYHFARTADDLADEGSASPAQRLEALNGFLQQLDRIGAGEEPLALPEGA